MQTSMQTTGRRNRRLSKLAKQTSRMQVVKRLTMQSLFTIAEYRAKYPECTKLKRLNWKQSQKYFKKIAKSKTYKDLCAKEDASRYGRLDPTLELAHFRGRTVGQAT